MLCGPDDPRADGYRHLIDQVRPRSGDRREGLFVAEGVRTIRQLLDQGWPLESLLLSEARCAARPDLVRDAAEAGVAVYTAGQDVFDRIAGFHVHRGALALAQRPTARSVEQVTTAATLVLVVEGVNDHENVGALFRNAAAFGVGAVVLDPSCADPLYRRSVRVSLGHVLTVSFARAGRWPAELSELRSLGLRLAALAPDGDTRIDDLAAGGRASGSRWAVMVGAEGVGLSPSARAEAEVSVRIPMAAGVDSLNVAVAAAVALHRLCGLA